MLSVNRKNILNLLSKNTIYERTTLYHSAIAEVRALDWKAQESSQVPYCASQSNAACRNIPRQWPAALRNTHVTLYRDYTELARRCELSQTAVGSPKNAENRSILFSMFTPWRCHGVPTAIVAFLRRFHWVLSRSCGVLVGDRLRAHGVLTACSRRAHGVLTACSRRAHGVLTACSRRAHGVLTACSRRAHGVLTACSRRAHGVLTACSRRAHGVLTACSRRAHGVSTACTPRVRSGHRARTASTPRWRRPIFFFFKTARCYLRTRHCGSESGSVTHTFDIRKLK